MDPLPAQQLNYAGPTVTTLPPAHRTLLYRLALVCWLLPLVTGVSIFTAFKLVVSTHHGHGHNQAFELLTRAGLLTIGVGTVLALIGAIAVLIFSIQRWSAATDRARQVIAPAALMVILLASNFPIAFVLMISAF